MCRLCVDDNENRAKKHRDRPVGGARNKHGTRVSAAIICEACGKRDHISFRPRPGARVLCRACAESLLGRYEAGVQRPREFREITCSLCGRQDHIPANVPDDPEIMCHDCVRGIYSHQSDRAKQGERRRSGTILARKKKPRAADDQG